LTVEYDKRLKNCENKGSSLDPKLKQGLTDAIQKLDKQKAELSKRLEELEKPILLIQEALAKACFAAGTKLWTPQGYRVVEEIGVGELVHSWDEWNPAAPVEAKVVEEVFRRFARVLDLRVAGELIRTT
jgi:hypothetical protein